MNILSHPMSHCTSAVLVLLLQLPQCHGGDIETEFLEKYREQEKQLIKKYVHNRKIRIVFKNYTDESYSGKLRAEVDAAIIATESEIRTIANNTEYDVSPARKSQSAVLWLGDEIYSVAKSTGNKFILESHYPEAKNFPKLEHELRDTRAFLPLSLTGGLRLSGYFKLMMWQRPRKYHFVVKSVNYEATYESKPAVELVHQSGSEHYEVTSYLDPNNSYALLHYKIDHQAAGVKVKSGEHAKTFGTITYADEKDGVRLPTKYVTWYEMPNGKKVPRAELTYLEYEHYTPTADDFDLEKQFGIKPFPKAPKPAGPRSYWLYYAAGGLGLVTVGLIAYRRYGKRGTR